MEARFAVALARVAEGFVERAVGAFGRVCEDARDDELRLVVEGFVGALAFGADLRPLVVEVVYATPRVQSGRGHGLELRERHSAERLLGRERPPSVQHPCYLLLGSFRTRRHVGSFLCAFGARLRGVSIGRAS